MTAGSRRSPAIRRRPNEESRSWTSMFDPTAHASPNWPQHSPTGPSRSPSRRHFPSSKQPRRSRTPSPAARRARMSCAPSGANAPDRGALTDHSAARKRRERDGCDRPGVRGESAPCLSPGGLRMRAFRLVGLLVLAAATAAVAAGGAAASLDAPHASRVVGHVYVNDNTAPVNGVAGFDRHADGSLTAIPGSPFAVGGSGRGHADASQGSLQLSADGRYLLAVDAGSNQISVLQIDRDGSLTAAAGSPVASGGVAPVSIG